LKNLMSSALCAMPYACPASPLAPADGTGVGPEDRTGRFSFDPDNF